jgi:hypothetical protein
LAEVTAQPVLPPIAFGGAFDQLYLGAPLYIWIMVFGTILFAAFFVYVVYIRYWILPPVWGYKIAYSDGKPVGFVISRTRKCKLLALKYISKVFEALDLPYAWLLTSTEATFSIGGVSCLICNDDWGIIRNPDLESAVRILKDRYNDGWTKPDGTVVPGLEMDKRFDAKSDRGAFDRFMAFLMSDEVYNYLDSDGMVAGVKLPPLRVVNLWDIKQYLASVDAMDASSHEGLIRAEVERRVKEQLGKGPNTAYWFVGGGVLLMVIFILGFVFLQGACPK